MRLAPEVQVQMPQLIHALSAEMDVIFVKKRKVLFVWLALHLPLSTKVYVSMNVQVPSVQAESLQMRMQHPADPGN